MRRCAQSAYVSIRIAYVSMRIAYVSIRTAYVSIRIEDVSIRQHTSAYISIRIAYVRTGVRRAPPHPPGSRSGLHLCKYTKQVN